MLAVVVPVHVAVLLLVLVFIFTVYPLNAVEVASFNFNVNVTLFDELTLAAAFNVTVPVIETFVLNVLALSNVAAVVGLAVQPLNVYPDSTVPVIACFGPFNATTVPPFDILLLLLLLLLL